MAGYVISCPSISSCLCCVSLDISLDGDTLKDLGAPVDTPLRASLGGEGEANAAVCGTSGASFIAEYGTDGQAPLVGGVRVGVSERRDKPGVGGRTSEFSRTPDRLGDSGTMVSARSVRNAFGEN